MELFRRGEDRRFTLDLAEHLRHISTPPPLPPQWRCEVAAATANDAAIGGDFTVFTLTDSPDPCSDESPAGRRDLVLRAMVVDASGKGAEAATRCVMLAGAITGLLTELPLEAVLPAVNRHVASLGSDENFATAVLVEVSLSNGDLRLGIAGHPPPAQFHAGSGRWHTYPTTGPALGLIPDAEWTLHSATLELDDALIIVTDGVVEVPGADLDWGVDRLLGHAERLVLTGWTGGAQELLSQRKGHGSDDAQVLLLSRQAGPRMRRSSHPSAPH